MNHMPVVIFFACLDFEQKASFPEGLNLSKITNFKLGEFNFIEFIH